MAADAAGRPKWFWLMNIADDSPWHAHIMDEFRGTLDDEPGDLVSFDGFEVDTYGDNASSSNFIPTIWNPRGSNGTPARWPACWARR